MPTHLELAMISKQAYFKQGGFVTGWNCLKYFEQDNGLAAVVYENNENEMVIAFRGTDTGNLHNFLKNILTNIHILLGKEPNTLTHACDFVKQIRSKRNSLSRLIDFLSTGAENQLFLTGHSLGGMLAQLVGYLMLEKGKNYKVVTFENPGIGHHIKPNDHILYHNKFYKNFTTYLADPNLINTLHPHVGKIQRIHLKPYSNNVLSKGRYYATHVADCLLNDMLRVILFLLLLNLVCSLLLKKQILPDTLTETTNKLSIFFDDNEYLPKEECKDHDIVLAFFQNLSFALFSKLVNKTIALTAQQHPLDAIITELTKGKGTPAQYSKIAQWPCKYQYLTSYGQQLLNWFNPRKHQGLLTIDKPVELHEKVIQNMPGYKERGIVSKLSGL